MIRTPVQKSSFSNDDAVLAMQCMRRVHHSRSSTNGTDLLKKNPATILAAAPAPSMNGPRATILEAGGVHDF